jgi:hypothetical protein
MQVQAFHRAHAGWQNGLCRAQLEAGAVVFIHHHRGHHAAGGPIVSLHGFGHELRARGLCGWGYRKPQAEQQEQ